MSIDDILKIFFDKQNFYFLLIRCKSLVYFQAGNTKSILIATTKEIDFNFFLVFLIKFLISLRNEGCLSKRSIEFIESLQYLSLVTLIFPIKSPSDQIKS